MKIKCAMLDAEDFDLIHGKVYEVNKIMDGGRYRVTAEDGVNTYMRKGEFEVVEEWSGEGLPPVGTVCEILGTPSGSWSEGSIDYIDSKHCIWHWVDGSQETMHNRVFAMQFRPIKSEKDKEIDKIASELLESVNKNGKDFRHLEWEIAEHLYNVGLRFTKESK